MIDLTPLQEYSKRFANPPLRKLKTLSGGRELVQIARRMYRLPGFRIAACSEFERAGYSTHKAWALSSIQRIAADNLRGMCFGVSMELLRADCRGVVPERERTVVGQILEDCKLRLHRFKSKLTCDPAEADILASSGKKIIAEKLIQKCNRIIKEIKGIHARVGEGFDCTKYYLSDLEEVASCLHSEAKPRVHVTLHFTEGPSHCLYMNKDDSGNLCVYDTYTRKGVIKVRQIPYHKPWILKLHKFFLEKDRWDAVLERAVFKIYTEKKVSIE